MTKINTFWVYFKNNSLVGRVLKLSHCLCGFLWVCLCCLVILLYFTTPKKYPRLNFSKARQKLFFFPSVAQQVPYTDLGEASVGGLSMRTQCAFSACSLIGEGSFTFPFNGCSAKPMKVQNFSFSFLFPLNCYFNSHVYLFILIPFRSTLFSLSWPSLVVPVDSQSKSGCV